MRTIAGTLTILPLLLLAFSSSLARVGEWDTCSGRLERALDTLHRESNRRNRLEDEDAGIAYQQELHSAPLDITVSHIAVKLPQVSRNTGMPWATVERCIYEPVDTSLKTRVVFNDLAVSGLVSLHARSQKTGNVPAESCRMTLRLRRAGIEFLTSPIARGRGQMRIRTESSFLEPRFASIYAYGCRPTRLDKQIKRQDKWPPYHSPSQEVPVLRPPSDTYDSPEPRQVSISKEDDVEIPNESRQSRALYPIKTVGIWRDNVWITKSTLRKKRASVHLPTLTNTPSRRRNVTSFQAKFDNVNNSKNKHKVVKKGNLRADVLYENSFGESGRLGPKIRSRRVRHLGEIGNRDGDDPVPRSGRTRRTTTLEVITPQDFQTALINEKLPKETETRGNLEKSRGGSENLRSTETSDDGLENSKSQSTTAIPGVSSLENQTNSTTWINSTGLLDSNMEDFGSVEKKSNFKRENNLGVSPETRESYLSENLEGYVGAGDEGRSWQSKEHIAREMEDVFLKGASQVLTRYIERQLHPAIKETLMLSMGYTISYG